MATIKQLSEKKEQLLTDVADGNFDKKRQAKLINGWYDQIMIVRGKDTQIAQMEQQIAQMEQQMAQQMVPGESSTASIDSLLAECNQQLQQPSSFGRRRRGPGRPRKNVRFGSYYY
jgi:hypothetical protein